MSLLQISIVLRKEVEDTGDNDYENHPYEPQELKYITGFRVGGGIDQDPKKCPYGFTDSVSANPAFVQKLCLPNSICRKTVLLARPEITILTEQDQWAEMEPVA